MCDDEREPAHEAEDDHDVHEKDELASDREHELDPDVEAELEETRQAMEGYL